MGFPACARAAAPGPGFSCLSIGTHWGQRNKEEREIAFADMQNIADKETFSTGFGGATTNVRYHICRLSPCLSQKKSNSMNGNPTGSKSTTSQSIQPKWVCCLAALAQAWGEPHSGHLSRYLLYVQWPKLVPLCATNQRAKAK